MLPESVNAYSGKCSLKCRMMVRNTSSGGVTVYIVYKQFICVVWSFEVPSAVILVGKERMSH